MMPVHQLSEADFVSLTQSQPRSKHFMGIQFLPFVLLHPLFPFTLSALVFLLPPFICQTMEVDMLLNMDGFDDNTTSVFYGANSWGAAFTRSPTSAFSPSASGSVAGNPTRSNMHSTDQTSSASDPSRSLISTRPLARSREDAPWQMYLSPSLSESLHSLDLDILNPNSVDLVYPQHDLADFAEFETLESPRSSGYQSTQTVNDIQQMFCATPLVAPQPRIVQPALLSLISTQDTENSLLLAQGESSTEADEHTVYTSSILDVGTLSAPQFDTYLTQSAAPSSSLLSSSRGRDPTITKLVNHSSTSTRPRRGLSGWGNTDHLDLPPSFTMHQKPPSTSSSKSLNSGLMVPDSLSPSLCSSTRGSSRNSERLLKRSRQSDESLPILKQASKTRRIMVADVDTEEDSVNNNGDDGDDSDSDDYRPSRSPSLNPSRSISPSSHSFVFKSETGVASSTSVKRKKPRKGKGKAKGSAALALAVVSQMVRNPSAAAASRDIDLTSTRYATTGFTRRKNQPIPLPIPVPNLNKKSRGRKVPHITNDNTVMKRKSLAAKAWVKKEEGVEDDDDDDDDDNDESGDEFEGQSRSSTRSRRKKLTPEMSKTPSGENRTFICVVPGCGKCFVRSEHLKRHVRSIHTHDKRESFLCLFRENKAFIEIPILFCFFFPLVLF